VAILKIISFPEKILRQKALDITEFDSALEKLAMDMAETMYDAPGIGLAAPQVGVSKKIAVIDLGKDDELKIQSKLYVLINPEIIKTSGLMKYEEGCLSISGIREYVERPSNITVKYNDLEGNNCIVEAEGLFAICIQHEIDHLNGILFIDHLRGLKRKIANKKLIKNFGTYKG